MGTSASGAATARTRTIIAALAAFALTLGLAPMAFAAEESVAGPLAGPGYEGDARSASADSDLPSAAEGLTLASTLAGTTTSIVSADVALDAAEPVIGSFTVDGLTYAVGPDGLTLVAVDAVVASDGAIAVPATVVYNNATYDVAAVGPYAFYLSGATSVELPASALSVDDRAFRSSDVERVDVAPGNPNLASYEGALYSADLTSLLLIPEGRTGSVPIPSEAEVVEPSVFSHCSLVDAISVDGGGAAFLSWDGLLYTSDGVTLLRVPAGATDITIRDGCTTIAAGAMEGCAKLERINAPASVTSISPDVFQSVPTVSLPAQMAVQDGTNPGVASGLLDQVKESTDSPDEGEAEGPGSAASQLTSMVALSTTDDELLEVDVSSATVVLPDDASHAPWEQIGFVIEGGNGDEAATEPLAEPMISEEVELSGFELEGEALSDGLPLAAFQSGSSYAAGTTSISPNGGYLWRYDTSLGEYDIQGNGDDATSSSWGYFYVDNPYLVGKDGQYRWVGIYEGVYSTGWSRVANEGKGGSKLSQGYALTATDGTIYACWPSVAVTFNKNNSDAGSTQGTTSTTCTVAQAMPRITKPTRPGYDFAGYYSAASGGTQYYNADGLSARKWDKSTATTLYAQWMPSVYKVTLDKNGGSGGTSTIYLKYATGWYSNAAATTNITSVTKPTLAGWTFAGYKGKDKNGTTYTYVSSDGSLKNTSAWWSDFTSDTTLTAVWTKSVTLDRQGGSGGSTSATYTKGEGFTGSITAPTLSGWTFLGYCDYDPSSSPGGNVYQMIKAAGTSTGRVYDSIGSTIYAWWAKEVTLDKYATSATAGKATKVWALKGAKLGYACTSSKGMIDGVEVDYEADVRAKFPNPSPLKASGWAPTRGSLASTWSFDGYWTAGADGNATQYVDSSGSGTRACPAGMPSTLYAQWTRSVTLDKQGGSGGSDSTSQLYKNGEASSFPYRAVAPPTTPPSGSPGGWQFLGYCDYNPSNNPSGSVYQMIKSDGSSTGRAYSSTTLYAWWVKQVALNKNASDATAGATTSVWALKGAKLGYACTTAATTEAEVRAKFPSSSPLKATGWSPTRTNRAFMGYSSTTADTGGTLYVDAAGDGQVAVDANCPSTLYARWGYTVTLDKQGGSGGAGSAAVEYNKSVPTVSTPTLPGWTFRGYTDDMGESTWLFVKADGTGTTRTITGNKTLYANWTKTVSLDANGGTEGSLTSITAAIGRTLGQKCSQVSSTDADYPIRSLFSKGITDDSKWAPTRAGFTFQGYYDTDEETGGNCYINGSGTAQSVCSLVTSMMPATLYARWSGNDIELTWDPHNGEEAATTTQTYSTTAKVVLPTAPTWTGRTFAGWYTAETGGTQVTNATDLPASSATCHAHWTEDAYAISYDYDGGSVSGNPTTYKVSSATFTLKNPIKTGYTFTGWSGTGLEGEGNMEVKVEKGSTGDRSYTAHWKANAYAVEYYDFAGTTLLSRDDGFVYDEARALAPEPDASIVTPGYEATGWAIEPGQTGAPYGFGISQQNLATGAEGDEVKRLYLAESPKNITLTWMSLGRQHAVTSETFSPDAKVPMPESMPSNDPGWAFMGWWTESDGGDEVTADTPLPTDSTTFYAHWAPVVSADVPIQVTARVDLLGLEEQVEASGYIESRCGEALKVAEVAFEPLAGATQLFGSRAADVALEALVAGGEGQWWASQPVLSFPLNGKGGAVGNGDRLAAFDMTSYGTHVGIGYRFDIPDDVLASIDPARFSDVTTPVGQVVYTVALA